MLMIRRGAPTGGENSNAQDTKNSENVKNDDEDKNIEKSKETDATVLKEKVKYAKKRRSEKHIKTGMNIIFETFKVGDEDGNHGIDAEKLMKVFEEIGEANTTLDECRDYIAQNDVDRSGRIEQDEFFDLFLLHIDQSSDTEKDILEAFEALDPLCTGFLPADTLRELLSNLGDSFSQSEINEFISKGDLDGDGWINYEALTKSLFDYEREYFIKKYGEDNLPKRLK